MQQGLEIDYKLLVHSVADFAIFMLDVEGRVRSWNLGAERIKGYREAEILGRHYSVFYGPDERAAGLPERCLAAAEARGHLESQGWRIRRDGTRFWAKIAIHALREAGRLVGFVKVTRDCSDERRHAAALEAMAGNLRTALTFLPYGACLLDTDRRLVLFNPQFQDLFVTAETGAYFADLVRPHLGNRSFLSDDLALATAAADGQPRDAAFGSSTIAVRMREAKGIGWVATFEDVTAQRRAGEPPLAEARRDLMTGLADGASLKDHLDRELARAGEGECAVLMLDLDHFKTINDVYGHHAGDLVIEEAARRILLALRPEDLACRVGGDAFVVVPAFPVTADQVARIATRLRDHLHRPYDIGPRQPDVGVSIGFATAIGTRTTADDLLTSGKLALREAKREGRGQICRYTDDLGIAVAKRRSLERRLRRALDDSEFSLVYQPICSTRTLETRGFEALLRWRQADGTVVPPGDFVPFAEELGLMGEIGAWVLETACLEAATWPAPLRIAVNVSTTQIRRGFVARVRAALETSGLAPSRLELEITETAMMRDCALSSEILGELRAMGISIAIDDFGTGYSSLSFLQTLPATRIKIDRSFVRDITENPHSRAIVRGMRQISRSLGLAVTAEGVETEAQRRALVASSCDEMQGYLIARPMGPERIAFFLEAAADPHAALERSA